MTEPGESSALSAFAWTAASAGRIPSVVGNAATTTDSSSDDDGEDGGNGGSSPEQEQETMLAGPCQELYLEKGNSKALLLVMAIGANSNNPDLVSLNLAPHLAPH